MKKDIWEKKFSDNFKPGLLLTLLKRWEVSRTNVLMQILPKNKEVIGDLACGDGDLIINLRGDYSSLIGFDIASNRIKKALKKIKELKIKNITFKKVDLDRGVPLNSGFADIIICEASLGYFYNTEYIISEINRVLKRGGYLVLQVPNYAFILRRLNLLFGFLPKTSSFKDFGDGGALHYFTYSELKNLLAAYNFQIELKTNSGLFPNIRKIWPELLAGDIIYKAKKIK